VPPVDLIPEDLELLVVHRHVVALHERINAAAHLQFEAPEIDLIKVCTRMISVNIKR
jgi:hypothetical protein